MPVHLLLSPVDENVLSSFAVLTDTHTNCLLSGPLDCNGFYKRIPLKPNRWSVAISVEVLCFIYIAQWSFCIHHCVGLYGLV